MSAIARVNARQILDSNGYPAVEVEVMLEPGRIGCAAGCARIKASAPSRERVAKYNRLLRIEEMLGSDASFAGLNAFYSDK